MSRLFSFARSFAAVALAALLMLATEAHARKVIKWTNLLPQATALQDPFNVLNQDQRFDIETIVWARGLTTEERELEHNRQPVEDAAKYEREFRKAGLNIEKLIKDQQVYEAEIARRQKLVNRALNGTDVKIAGYLLPLEFSEKGEKDFFSCRTSVRVCMCRHHRPTRWCLFVWQRRWSSRTSTRLYGYRVR